MKNVCTRTLTIALAVAAFAVVITTAANYPNTYGQSKSYAAATPTYTLRTTGAVAMRLSGTLNLFGTSTLHDWEMSAHQLQGSAQFNLDDKGALVSVSSLNFILPVHNLKGEKESMNDNAYDALKADQYKNITFVMTSSKIDTKGGNKYQIHANGNLTIAGVTRPIAMEVAASVNGDGTIGCTGVQAIKMSDFNIERPSFMFGAMKTGNDLKLSFGLLFTK
jgi:polyisoprenoid-binding protein YceI